MTMIRNMSDMNKVIAPYLEKAMVLTRDQVFEIVWRHVMAYYEDPVFSPPDKKTPDEYIRTGTLMESLTASQIQKTGDGFYFTVGFDDYYVLSFKYPFSGRGTPATGYDVLNWNLQDSSHGGTVMGNVNIWQGSIDELNSLGGIASMFKSNCKRVGLPIV